MPLRLVQRAVSAEALAAVASLLHEIESGRVQGVIFVAMETAHSYTADIVGIAKTYPSEARGALQALNDALGAIVGSK